MPSQRDGVVSSTIRLTSSMSVTFPVSFQYPEMTDERTVLPWSMSHWMASVISSSPRHDGLRCRTASCTEGLKMYTPTSARLLFGLLWLLLQADHLPGFVEFRHTEVTRIGHRREHDLRVRPLGAELLYQRGDAADDEVVAEVHDEVVLAKVVPGHEDGVCQAERRRLPDVGGAETKRRAVTYRRLDRLRGIPHHQPDIGNAGIADGLEAVKQDRLISHG